MKTAINAVLLGSSLIFGSAMATPVYIQADHVEGLATLNYDISLPMNSAPEFTFEMMTGSLSHNLADYTPGDYTVELALEGFWIDTNNDTIADYRLDSLYLSTSESVTLGPLPPLTGSDGAFSWDVNPATGSVWLSYDFDSALDVSGLSNYRVNAALAVLDMEFTGTANGVMDAIVGWDSMRIELEPVDVPEPSLWLLSGIGLMGFGWARRQRKRIVR